MIIKGGVLSGTIGRRIVSLRERKRFIIQIKCYVTFTLHFISQTLFHIVCNDMERFISSRRRLAYVIFQELYGIPRILQKSFCNEVWKIL